MAFEACSSNAPPLSTTKLISPVNKLADGPSLVNVRLIIIIVFFGMRFLFILNLCENFFF